MKLRATHKEARSLSDMTSMIDIVFLLLIFFMCATQFRCPEGMLKSYLPKEGGPGKDDFSLESCRIGFSVAANGETVVRVDGQVIVNNRVGDYEQQYLPGRFAFDQNALRQHLKGRMGNYSGLQSDLPVTLDFPENVPWRYVVDVFNVCHELDVRGLRVAMPERPYDE